MKPAPLIRIWLALMALTIVAILTGHVGSAARLAGWEIALLLGLAVTKARLVLTHYLELPKTSAWNSAILGSTGALMVVILGLAMVA